MLRDRLLTSGLLIAVMLVLIYLDYHSPLRGVSGSWLLPAGYFFAIGTALDLERMLQKKWRLPTGRIPGTVAVVMLFASFPILGPLIFHGTRTSGTDREALGWAAVGITSAVFLNAIFALQDFSKQRPNILESLGMSSLAASYLGGGFSFWIILRLAGEHKWGLLALVGVIAVAKISDSAAYFVGRFLGRSKLCPSISPKKTWEGAIGGGVGAILVSIAVFCWFTPWVFGAQFASNYLLGAILTGLLIAVAGLMGDLIESVVKRTVEVKDSGNSLPGLGGVWDLTDSLLPASLVGYLCVLAQWIWMPGVVH